MSHNKNLLNYIKSVDGMRNISKIKHQYLMQILILQTCLNNFILKRIGLGCGGRKSVSFEAGTIHPLYRTYLIYTPIQSYFKTYNNTRIKIFFRTVYHQTFLIIIKIEYEYTILVFIIKL